VNRGAVPAARSRLSACGGAGCRPPPAHPRSPARVQAGGEPARLVPLSIIERLSIERAALGGRLRGLLRPSSALALGVTPSGGNPVELPWRYISLPLFHGPIPGHTTAGRASRATSLVSFSARRSTDDATQNPLFSKPVAEFSMNAPVLIRSGCSSLSSRCVGLFPPWVWDCGPGPRPRSRRPSSRSTRPRWAGTIRSGNVGRRGGGHRADRPGVVIATKNHASGVHRWGPTAALLLLALIAPRASWRSGGHPSPRCLRFTVGWGELPSGSAEVYGTRRDNPLEPAPGSSGRCPTAA